MRRSVTTSYLSWPSSFLSWPSSSLSYIRILVILSSNLIKCEIVRFALSYSLQKSYNTRYLGPKAKKTNEFLAHRQRKKILLFTVKFQVLTGVGFAICVSCMFQSMVDMAVITWSSKAFYLLFTEQSSKQLENFFFDSVLETQVEDGQPPIALDNLGVLHGQLSLCLGIACLVIFILIAAGTKSVGKVIKIHWD